MKKLLLTFCILLFSCYFASAQSWLWGRAGYGSFKADDNGSPVATDKFGNAYRSGQYRGSITFGSITLTDTNDNAYLVKFNSTGIVQWARQPNQSISASSFGVSVATDTLGNAYVTGFFNDTITFGTYRLFSKYKENTFIVKYDPNGNVLWAKQSYAPTLNCNGYSNGIAIDEKGNAFITGYFYDTITFGTHTLTEYNNSGMYYNVFLVKYDSSGNVIWARQSTTPKSGWYSYGAANSVAVDGLGNAYITGFFSDTIQFGANTLLGTNYSGSGQGNIFLAKYDSLGNAIWARQSTNPSSFSYGEGYAVITDNYNNPYITSNFTDTICFGKDTLKTGGEIFLVKYDKSGNFKWAEQSNYGNWYGISLAKNAKYIYLGGVGSGDSVGLGGLTIKSTPIYGSLKFSLMCELDTSGKAICGTLLANGSGGVGYYIDIASDKTGEYVYMAGLFYNDSLICGPDTMISPGGEIPYIARWNGCDAEEGINGLFPSNNSVMLYPNPNNGEFIIQSSVVSRQSTIEVYNMLGEKIYVAPLNPPNRGTSSTSITLPIGAGQGGAGIYLYRVTSESGKIMGEGKFIIE